MRVYLSHAMRGKAGADASVDTQAINCAAAIEIAKVLRNVFPEVLDLYVPAETEPFVQAAYDAGYMNVEQILEIDCRVIDGCDSVIIFVPEGDELQGGRLVERDYANETNCPVMIFTNVKQAIKFLQHQYFRG